jgi:predicted lysophospholipase L1 biosynthesis ABC-type transport system permease subunit
LAVPSHVLLCVMLCVDTPSRNPIPTFGLWLWHLAVASLCVITHPSVLSPTVLALGVPRTYMEREARRWFDIRHDDVTCALPLHRF